MPPYATTLDHTTTYAYRRYYSLTRGIRVNEIDMSTLNNRFPIQPRHSSLYTIPNPLFYCPLPLYQPSYHRH